MQSGRPAADSFSECACSRLGIFLPLSRKMLPASWGREKRLLLAKSAASAVAAAAAPWRKWEGGFDQWHGCLIVVVWSRLVQQYSTDKSSWSGIKHGTDEVKEAINLQEKPPLRYVTGKQVEMSVMVLLPSATAQVIGLVDVCCCVADGEAAM